MQLAMPLHPPRHPCRSTFSAIAASLGPMALVSASMKWRRGLRPAGPFALGCGGGRVVIRGLGITGRGATWAEAAGNWLAGASCEF